VYGLEKHDTEEAVPQLQQVWGRLRPSL